MIPLKFDGSHLTDQLRHERTAEQLAGTSLTAICDRDNHICILPPDATDLCRPSILLYTEKTTDEQLYIVMLALGNVIRGPFRALGITAAQLDQCAQAGALLVDYVFDSCTIPDGGVRVHNLTVTSSKVC